MILTAGETEVLGKHLLQCYCVHHKYLTVWPETKPGPLLWEAGRCLIARAIERISKSGVHLIRVICKNSVLTSQRTQFASSVQPTGL